MTLPIYDALINFEDEGIFNISLVDNPATEVNWVAFEKQEPPMMFSVTNEEERVVCGVLMRADHPIYRYSPDMGEFYILYSKETIKKMSEKLLYDNNQNSVNLMHVPGSNVEGVYMTSLFIKDVEKGINPAGFEQVEDGSLFASFHVTNEEIWNQIKQGTYKSFSIEGYFTIDKESKNQSNMSIKDKIKNALVQFGEITTDKGVLYWLGDEPLKVGDEVFIGEDKSTHAETGDYTLEDGVVIKIQEGVVMEILEVKDANVEEEMDVDKEPSMMKEEEKVLEVEAPEKPKVEYVSKEEFEELKGVIEELKLEVERLKEELAKPVSLPVEEEFSKVTKSEKNMSHAEKIVSAFKRR